MKPTFHQRWQTLTQAARQSPPEEPSTLPLGFTTQLLARLRQTPADPLQEFLTALGMRAALTAAVVFTAAASLFWARLDTASLTPLWIESPITSQLPLP
jgi:hypothetical protein